MPALDMEIISEVFVGSVIREGFGKIVHHEKCARDEGKTPGTGFQEQAPNYLKLCW
jgi:hypothetical protein